MLDITMPERRAKLDGLIMNIKRCALIVSALFLMNVAQAPQSVRLESIGFANLPGDSVEITLGFDGAPPQPDSFVLDNPARISIDLAGVASGLSQQRYNIDANNAESVVVIDDGSRTRLIVNLDQLVNYDANITGNDLVLRIGADTTQVAGAVAATPVAQAAAAGSQAITDVNFRRGGDDEGQVVIDLSSDRVVGSIEQIGARVYVEFSNTSVPEQFNRRYDVTDFATPVSTFDVVGEDGNATIVIDVDGAYEYVAYQSGSQYTVSVQPPAVNEVAVDPTAAYTGEISSLTFQDVEIHSVLQILADEYDFNLVAPSVEGNITLHLENVPWDQALELVLRAGDLDSRLNGNVLYVAPAEEIAAQEQAELDATRQAQQLAPLYTEFVQINYANANDILALLLGSDDGGGGPVTDAADGAVLEASGDGILSNRGTATVDARTNIIIVRDVEDNLAEVRTLVDRLDVPVRQVLIEARIVNVSTDYGRDIGVRWGGGGRTDAHDNFRYGGSLDTNIEQVNNQVAREIAVQNALIAGDQAYLDAIQDDALDQALIPQIVQAAVNSVPIPVGSISFPNALAVDLGVEEETASSFAIGFTGSDGLIELELSALESSGNGEVIARPKVTTQDKVTAIIRSGLRIPYQAQAGGTAGGSTVEFEEAVLSLEVTPQITPDGRIIMQLIINQDSVAPNSGQIPAINTNSLETSVLVDNGETIVLGGVFREEISTLETKTPVLGDVPYVGNLFKRRENTSRRTELLIFITPKVISELNVL